MQNKSSGHPTPIHELLSSLGVKSPDIKHQAHGLTVGEMKELKDKQANREDLEEVPASENSSVMIKKHEAHLVHVLLENERWKKGKKLSKPRLQKFYVNDFEQMAKVELGKGEKSRPQNAFGGYDSVIILHDPRKKTKTSAPKQTEVVSTEDLAEMNIEDLRSKYEEVFGVQADEDDSIPQLVTLITEQLSKQA